MQHIRLATPLDRAAIKSLRVAQYQRSAEFVLLDPDAMAWDPDLPGNLVLAAWDGSVLVSTMQGSVVWSAAQAEELLQCRVVLVEESFPCLALVRAATEFSHRQKGLNSAMRYHFLRAAADAGLRAVIGGVYEGAPRNRIMAAIGYEFSSQPFWEVELRSYRDYSLAVLPAAKLQQAIITLHEHTASVLAEYPWSGPALDIPLAARSRD